MVIKGRIAKFRINPGLFNFYEISKSHYYEVHVFESPETMHLYGEKIIRDIADHQNDWGAITSPLWRFVCKGEKEYIKPKIGNILFWQGQLGVTVVCHECVHAATSFLRLYEKLNLSDQIDDNEELLAHCIGSLSRQTYNKLYKLQIL